MKCPKCGADLEEREFQHVKVDTCPECKGMWLDAGELDMIKYVDRNAIGRFVGSLFGHKP
jgi:Zn-finger nucleic acid-binding protein